MMTKYTTNKNAKSYNCHICRFPYLNTCYLRMNGSCAHVDLPCWHSCNSGIAEMLAQPSYWRSCHAGVAALMAQLSTLACQQCNINALLAQLPCWNSYRAGNTGLVAMLPYCHVGNAGIAAMLLFQSCCRAGNAGVLTILPCWQCCVAGNAAVLACNFRNLQCIVILITIGLKDFSVLLFYYYNTKMHFQPVFRAYVREPDDHIG